jgi:hypothetical protein
MGARVYVQPQYRKIIREMADSKQNQVSIFDKYAGCQVYFLKTAN